MVNLKEQNAVPMEPRNGDRFGYIVITRNPADLALYSGTLSLLGPFPNPFRGAATIEYTLPYSWGGSGAFFAGEKQRLSLSLYSITGKRVVTLVDELRAPGVYRSIWNGENGSGRQVSAGMYIMRLQYGNNIRTTRLYRIR